MKILNVRLGLATNSSSSHSLIFLPRGTNAEAVDPANGTNCYGWDYFQLVTPEAKRDYLATAIFSQLRHEMGDEIAETVARAWVVGTTITEDAYIDHQSTWTFPRNWDGKGLDREFFDDFEQFIMRDDLIIAGGNDNDDEAPQATYLPGTRSLGRVLPVESYRDPYVARKDGDYWTLFNRENGTKIRLTFKGDEFKGLPTRSRAPELIDIKITDYCPFDCGYCYQGSTKEGKHAETSWISSLAYNLRDLRVFEVALGGGEPTLHPQFTDILQSFRYNNIVPNFTTKNLGWLKDKEKRTEIFEKAGAFAYSAETADNVKELIALAKKHDIATGSYHYSNTSMRATIQHVVGVADEAEFRKILETCAKNYLPITLLGYKEVGRGPLFGKKPSSKWLKVVKEVSDQHHLRVGIDTALADSHWEALLEAGVKETCMTRVEGQFSCYIDAVAKTINVSSYTTSPGTPIKFGTYHNPLDIGELYRNLQAT